MAFVVSEGSVRGLSRPAVMPSTSLRLADDYTADYAQIWRAQGAVRTVVDFLGRNIGSLGLHLYRRVSDTDRERVTDHPLASLLGRPNPRTTRYRLLDAMVRDLGIYDRAYWLKMKKGPARWLLRLPPSLVTPVGDSWLWPEAFEFAGDRGKRVVPADEVVHFRGYSPEGDLAGASSIESLRRVLSEEYEAGRMREQMLRNGARASGYLERPAPVAGATSTWSEAARERFRKGWQSQYSGNGPQAGGTPILEDGMKFTPASQTSEQLQYVEARKLTREEAASAYFIPPTMVGIMDSATFSNIKEQHKHLYQDTLGPWLSMIVEELALQLMPDFADTSDMYLEFNLAEKMRGSFEEQAGQLQSSVGGPWLTRNEARARQNLPSLEGGDELIVPMNVTEGGQASPQDSAPVAAGETAGPARPTKALPAVRIRGKAVPSDDDRADAVALFESFFARQRRAVTSAIGAGGDWWDTDRWDAELAADLYALAVSVSTKLGRSQAGALGFDPGDYDVPRTLAFLQAVSASRAEWVNNATRDQVAGAIGDESEDGPTPESVFDEAEAVRSISAGQATVTTVGAFAAVEAAKQLAADRTVKTWVTTSGNPRPSHAAMAGETVPIGGQFSNGLDWPGDPVMGADEVSGCECTVTVSVE